MVYTLRHVRVMQQSTEEGHTALIKIDGLLNPTDPMNKWLPPGVRKAHFAFLMGRPAEALRLRTAARS